MFLSYSQFSWKGIMHLVRSSLVVVDAIVQCSVWCHDACARMLHLIAQLTIFCITMCEFASQCMSNVVHHNVGASKGMSSITMYEFYHNSEQELHHNVGISQCMSSHRAASLPSPSGQFPYYRTKDARSKNI